MLNFNKTREQWNKLDDDEKVAAAAAIVVAAFLSVLFLLLIVTLIKELFVPALVFLAVYSIGAAKWNWPVPKKIKQFFIK